MAAVAVIQTAFIGDVVLATPLFEAARVSNPGDRVIAVVRPGCDNLIETSPFVDDIIVWDKRGTRGTERGVLGVARRLRTAGVHTALVPHRSIRSALAARLCGARLTVGFARGGGGMLHSCRVPYRLGIHEVERNLMLARAAGWHCEGLRPAIIPDDRDLAMVDDIAQGFGTFCVFAPGSVWPTKMWPFDYYAETGTVMAAKGLSVLISGGPDDAALCESLASRIPGAVSLAGILTLRQSAALYARAAFVLTGDSAPQHIAAAAGARVFALFGPTVRDFGFWPYSERGVVLEESMDCRPCGVHGHRACPRGHHRCMGDLTPERVVAAIEADGPITA